MKKLALELTTFGLRRMVSDPIYPPVREQKFFPLKETPSQC